MTRARLTPHAVAPDLHRSPVVVFFEVTRACALACRHCRASAMRRPHRDQLGFTEACAVLDQFAEFSPPPIVVLTGGDPLERDDLFALIRHGRSRGLTVAVAPSATPRLTPLALERFVRAGVHRLGLSLDGSNAATHDTFRRVAGTFERGVEALRAARRLGLPTQINTTIHRGNMHQVHRMAKHVRELGAVLWSVFFLVPVGRALREDRVPPAEYERVFGQLHAWSRRGLAIKTTEAPFYRRYVMQRGDDPLCNRRGPEADTSKASGGPVLGVNDGKGVMFVSHTGRVQASGFLPIVCGRAPRDHVVTIYQRHPHFRALRDPDRLGGKCGRCDFRTVCGGSRARAYAVSGNPLAEEPDCLYEPPTASAARRCPALEPATQPEHA